VHFFSPRKDDPDEPAKPNKPALTKEMGLNRVQWNLHREGAKLLTQAKIDAGNPEAGPLVLPGRYTLTLSVAGKTYTTEGEVAVDPRSTATAEDMRTNYEFALRTGAALDPLEQDIEAVRVIRAQAEVITKLTAQNPTSRDLQASADALVKRCDEIESSMHNPEAKVVYDVLAGREGGAKLYSQLSTLYSGIQASDYAPTQGQSGQLEENLAALSAMESEFAAMRAGELARLGSQANALALPRVIVPDKSRSRSGRQSGSTLSSVSSRSWTRPRSRVSRCGTPLRWPVAAGPCCAGTAHSFQSGR
jgi:hypothetical protein